MVKLAGSYKLVSNQRTLVKCSDIGLNIICMLCVRTALGYRANSRVVVILTYRIVVLLLG